MTKTVFTNGCFEILHPGHIYCLNEAKKLGDKLIVGLNSDSSFRKVKGRDPIILEQNRKYTLENLKCVDEVIVFNESRPDNLIKKIKPNILVKGGDWRGRLEKEEEILKEFSGKIHIIDRISNLSTSNIIEKVLNLKTQFSKHISTIYQLNSQNKEIEEMFQIILSAIKNGSMIFICGNGGSAADAQHFAAELISCGVKAIALTTDTSVITSISNDFSFEEVFSTQLKTLAKRDDVVILISTSGLSINIINAAIMCERIGCKSISLTGRNSDFLKVVCKACIQVPSTSTPIIQEAHILILHHIYLKIKKLKQQEG